MREPWHRRHGIVQRAVIDRVRLSEFAAYRLSGTSGRSLGMLIVLEQLIVSGAVAAAASVAALVVVVLGGYPASVPAVVLSGVVWSPVLSGSWSPRCSPSTSPCGGRQTWPRIARRPLPRARTPAACADGGTARTLSSTDRALGQCTATNRQAGTQSAWLDGR